MHDEAATEFLFLLIDVARLARQQFDQAIVAVDLGLTPGEVRALAHVQRYNGLKQATLAELLGVEPVTVSSYVDRLEARGFVRRTADPKDRRTKLVTVTPDAETVFSSARPIVDEVYRTALEGLSEDTRQLMAASLEEVRGNLASAIGAHREMRKVA